MGLNHIGVGLFSLDLETILISAIQESVFRRYSKTEDDFPCRRRY
jgi:hypothetical protein